MAVVLPCTVVLVQQLILGVFGIVELLHVHLEIDQLRVDMGFEKDFRFRVESISQGIRISDADRVHITERGKQITLDCLDKISVTSSSKVITVKKENKRKFLADSLETVVPVVSVDVLQCDHLLDRLSEAAPDFVEKNSSWLKAHNFQFRFLILVLL